MCSFNLHLVDRDLMFVYIDSRTWIDLCTIGYCGLFGYYSCYSNANLFPLVDAIDLSVY